MNLDPYQILDISPDADESVIKRAYRSKAATLHPDKSTGSAEAFKELTEAFNFAMRVAADAKSRSDNVIPGEDMSVEVSVTLEEAILGCVKEIIVPSHTVTCMTCDGTGKDPSVAAAPCFTCMGRKFVFDASGSMMKCRSCGGTGSVMTVSCDQCKGTGKVRRDVAISISIPAGVDKDSEIKFSGQGLPGVNAPGGDLYVKVRQKKHRNFLRKGDDLTVSHTVTFSDLMTGTDVKMEVPGHGEIKVPIPPMMQPGSEAKVKGKGVRNVHTGIFGDLLIKVEVKFPRKLSSRAKLLMQELATELKHFER